MDNTNIFECILTLIVFYYKHNEHVLLSIPQYAELMKSFPINIFKESSIHIL